MKAKKNLVYGTSYFFLFSFSFLLVSCDSTEPPPVGVNIKLTEIDKAVKETYLHLSNTSGIADGIIVLTRNGTEILSFSAGVKDTIVTDTALTQNTTYKYEAVLKRGNETIEKSSQVPITTLLPTSHDIIWQTWTFDEQASGRFLDVAIIDENNIWVVGEIRLKEFLGDPEYIMHTAAHWNGEKWELIRLKTELYGGFIREVCLYTVFAHNENNIWVFSEGGGYANWNGSRWRTKFLSEIDGGGFKLYGTKSNLTYLVGTNGAISYHDGSRWQKIPSGTEYAIFDIWGYINPLNQKEELICAATDYYEINKSCLLKITDIDKVDSISLGTNRFAAASWTKNGFPVYVCGDGIFTNKTGKWKEITTGPAFFSNDIRGTALNDIFVVGDFGLFMHYNGDDWKIYDDIYYSDYITIAIKDNLIVAVGQRIGKGVITIGRRN